MTDNQTDMEKRLEELTKELLSLKQRLDSQPETQRSSEFQDKGQDKPAGELPSKAGNDLNTAPTSAQTEEILEITDELVSWAGKASLLPRMSALCFLLVVALILRTITESGLINTLAGSVLGMGYASAMMMLGWYKYRQESPLAPVFAGCGAVLISTIVVETHMHFLALPIIPAYLTLMATGIAMAVVSYKFNAFTPISLGTLSMCLAGAAMDYPNPHFPYLAMILVTANILGYFAARLKRCSWLRWILLVVTLIMLHLWALRLGTALYRKIPPEPALALPLFFPVLIVFAFVYLTIGLLGIMRSGNERISRFDFSLPTINVAWTFAAAYYVVGAGGSSKFFLGCTGVILAVIHLGIGYRLACRHLERAPGTNSLVFAGSFLAILSLPVALGSTIFALPILSLFAFTLLHFSGRWQSGGVRITSYALQIYCATTISLILFGQVASQNSLTSAGSALAVTLISFLHYRFCRKGPPPANSEIFTRFDSRDRTAIGLLIASLVSGFFLARLGVYHLLLRIPGEITNSFRCAQSVLINTAAIGLMLIAFRNSNREVRNVAILVTIIGGFKVFFSDLFGTHGLPLVISVFSFGLAAAIESVALGKWGKTKDVTMPDATS